MESRLRRKTSSQHEESPRKKRREEKTFVIGEKILCYEPDEKLQKVLYDARISDVYETNKRGSNKFEYLVHFLGWNSSWDRKVSEDFLLKDTPENRQLQRELAEKNSLQLGAYLYRKEKKRRMKMKMNERKLLLSANNEEVKEVDQNELEYSSSATESHDDDRVFLHIGEVLKLHLEFDHKMTCDDKIMTKIPAELPVVTILESFVKSYALKVVTSATVKQEQPKRRSSIIFGRNREIPKVSKIDYDEIENDINLCKETADGLRVYFNFILKDFLLYPEESEFYNRIMPEGKFKGQVELKKPFTIEDFVSKQEKFQNLHKSEEQNENSEQAEKRSSRLRSHSSKVEEDEKLENLSSMASTSSCDSMTPSETFVKKGIFSGFWFPIKPSLSTAGRKILEDVFAWEMIPPNSDGDAEASMVFGIHHLLRLVVKLPEFLTSTLMNEQKMKYLLKFLDEFVEFLEENVELYGEKNFMKSYEIKKEEN